MEISEIHVFRKIANKTPGRLEKGVLQYDKPENWPGNKASGKAEDMMERDDL